MGEMVSFRSARLIPGAWQMTGAGTGAGWADISTALAGVSSSSIWITSYTRTLGAVGVATPVPGSLPPLPSLRRPTLSSVVEEGACSLVTKIATGRLSSLNSGLGWMRGILLVEGADTAGFNEEVGRMA